MTATEHFTRNIVEQSERLCACGREPMRPGQRDGLICHALAQKTIRLREKQRRESANRIALEGIACRAAAQKDG